MAADEVAVSAADTSIQVEPKEEHLHFAHALEVINISLETGQIQFAIKEERLDFSTPLVLAVPGWPFGPNPNKVADIQENETAVVDVVAMPSYYRVVKWMMLVSDEDNGLSVTSEVKCMVRDTDVYFMEYAIIGDMGLLTYGLDAELDGERVKLSLTNQTNRVLTVRTTKIGIFNG